jgi:porin
VDSGKRIADELVLFVLEVPLGRLDAANNRGPLTVTSPTHRRCLAAAFITSAGLTPIAFAQDSTDFVFEAGPQDLPGVEKGPRQRPPAPLPPPVPAPPAPPPELPEWFGGKPFWEWSHLTGNWGGLRDSLEEKGFSFAGSYTLDWIGVWSGGASNRASTRTLLDLNGTFDLEKIVNLKGGTFFLDFYSTDMRGLDDVGDFQGVSSITTAENDDQLGQAWYEQWLFNKVVRVKVGKVDAQTEFAFIKAASDFMNLSVVFSPTLIGMPTYPDPAFGANIFVYPTENIYVGAAAYDGAAGANDSLRTGGHGTRTVFSDTKSSDWYFITEAGLTWSQAAALGKGRFAAGLWHHTGDFERFDGGLDSGATGFYLIAEQQLLRRGGGGAKPAEGEDDPGADQGVFAFGVLGWSNDEISDVGLHLVGGLSLKGTFDGRDDDAAGLAATWADLSDKAGYVDDETEITLFYKVQCTGFVTLTPTLTWVLNPSGDPSLDDAVVGALRVAVTF